jgi:hypothetical protein
MASVALAVSATSTDYTAKALSRNLIHETRKQSQNRNAVASGLRTQVGVVFAQTIVEFLV